MDPAAINGQALCVMVSTPTERAPELARHIVAQRLAACVQLLPMQSVYRWQGEICDAAETLLLCKTVTQRYAELESCLHQHHPYELPEIIALPVTQALPAYLHWLLEETRPC